MAKKIIYILCVICIFCATEAYSVGAYISLQKISDLDFGTAIPLASSGIVTIGNDGEPIWLRCMKSGSSTYPSAGEIAVTSLYGKYLIVRPRLQSVQLSIQNGQNCSIQVRGLNLSATEITVPPNSTRYVDIGGSLNISGFCLANYEYTGSLVVEFDVLQENNTLITTQMLTVPVRFYAEHKTDVIKDNDMSFGKIKTNKTAGTVVLSTSGNVSSNNEGFYFMGGATAGEVSIFGAEMMQVNITHDNSITLYKDGGTSGSSMVVDNFTLNPGSFFKLDSSRNNQGYKKLSIGGTLHVNANQPAGYYSGVLSVTVSY